MLNRARVGTGVIISAIRDLELRVSLSKSEALEFHSRMFVRASELKIRLANDATVISSLQTMKYLGFTLDGVWSFRSHFARVAKCPGEAVAEPGSGLLFRWLLANAV